ncbi:hypothetical protein CU048_10655 [Beijerinckiaceae bacterium]|nr:hypothetical protein CU048_10655 [Beijerinckiaceae bacterium]
MVRADRILKVGLKKGRLKMAVVNSAATSSIGATEGSGASLVILIAMIILFGTAAYFTGRLYGRTGMIAVIAGFFVVLIGLFALGGISFG